MSACEWMSDSDAIDAEGRRVCRDHPDQEIDPRYGCRVCPGGGL